MSARIASQVAGQTASTAFALHPTRTRPACARTAGVESDSFAASITLFFSAGPMGMPRP